MKKRIPIDQTFNWRYVGRAYCHQDGGYWLSLYERRLLVHLDESEKVVAESERPGPFYVWGELLKHEAKFVNEETKVEKIIPYRTWYWVTPNTKHEIVGGSDG